MTPLVILLAIMQSTPPPASEAIRPFKVSVPQAAIDDLRRRIAATRWPDQETVPGWTLRRVGAAWSSSRPSCVRRSGRCARAIMQGSR
jgi:epoxide hydrolase-like protein